MIMCKNSEDYRPGTKVKSLVNRPPTIQIGAPATILNRLVGTLYAVKMPNGDLYRWLDSLDLASVNPAQPNLRVGDLAVVKLDGHKHAHFYHPELKDGSIVKVIKIIDSDYYDVKTDGLGAVGWLTGFEISTVF